MYVTTTLARRRASVFLSMNSNQNATYCFLKQSKRATSVSEVVGHRATGDPAMLDRVWTSVVAREHIVVEIQIFCKQRTNQENIIHEGACEKEKELASSSQQTHSSSRGY
jgi:hypothetical protein